MKHWRIALAALLGLLLIGAAFVWFMPARWVVPLLAGRLNGIQLEQVSGLLWSGRAGRVLSAKGEELGQLEWQLSRRALLGDTDCVIDLQGIRLEFHGRMQGRSATEALWTDVHMRADLGLLNANLALPGGGQPRGTIKADVPRAQLQGGWPLLLDADLDWQDASLRAPRQGDIPLGALRLSLKGNSGVIDGHLADNGDGPLRIDGTLQLSPLGWRFNAVAAPRRSAPTLTRWLATFGAVDADGVTHIHYTGGLAATLSGRDHG